MSYIRSRAMARTRQAPRLGPIPLIVAGTVVLTAIAGATSRAGVKVKSAEAEQFAVAGSTVPAGSAGRVLVRMVAFDPNRHDDNAFGD